MSALSRIAIDDHRYVKLGPEDTVVLSARAIPGNEKWTLVVNKAANVWGTEYDQSQDLARFDLPVHKTAPVEEFTIALKKKSDNSAEISFAWGTQTVTTTLTIA